MAQTRKNLYKNLMVVFFIFLLSVATAFIPGFDLVKSLALAVCASVAFLFQAKGRCNEEETDRYRRLCGERYPVVLKNHAYMLSNLLVNGDIPYKWMGWLKNLGVDIKEEARGMLHAVDSLCHFGDEPAQGIARATYFVATAKAKGQSLEEALKLFVSENSGALGQEISKGCFLKKLEAGQPLPYGIFQATPSTRLLCTFYAVQVCIESLNFWGQKTQTIKEVSSMRICVKSGMDAEATKKIVHEIFPELAPKNFGSGPQQSGLFVQETVHVDKASAESRLSLLVERLGLK